MWASFPSLQLDSYKGAMVFCPGPTLAQSVVAQDSLSPSVMLKAGICPESMTIEHTVPGGGPEAVDWDSSGGTCSISVGLTIEVVNRGDRRTGHLAPEGKECNFAHSMVRFSK